MIFFNNEKLVFSSNEKERFHYFMPTYFLMIISIGFFIVKNYFSYGLFNSSYYSILFLALFVASPLLGFVIKRYFILVSIILSLASTALAILVFEAGGFNAPGALWVCSIPLTYFILLGSRGGIVGGIYTLIVFLIFIILKQLNIVGSIVLTEKAFDSERIIDLITFTIYVFCVSFFFVLSEEKSREQIKKFSHEIENLLRVVIHDIANPVSVSLLSLDVLDKKDASEEKVSVTKKRIKNALKTISNILNEVRTLKAIRDGKLDFVVADINLDEQIKNIININEPKAEAKNIYLEYTNTTAHPIISGNEVAVNNMVISNFLTNAIKFSAPFQKIILKIEDSPQGIIFSIRDFGVGIPKPILENIWSFNSATSRVGTAGESGTGYGMPIAKAFLDKMEAALKIESVTQEQIDAGKNKSSLKEPGTLITVCFKKNKLTN